MAQVVGHDTSAMKRITHRACGAVVEYAEREVRTLWSGTDYGGGPDGAKGLTCPNCGDNIITERW